MLPKTALQSQPGHGYLNLSILDITRLNSTSCTEVYLVFPEPTFPRNGQLKTIGAVGAT